MAHKSVEQSAEIERLHAALETANANCDRMASLAIDNAKDTARLRAALERAAKELELLYFFAISNGIAEAGIPPHVEARAAITAQPAAPGGDA